MTATTSCSDLAVHDPVVLCLDQSPATSFILPVDPRRGRPTTTILNWRRRRDLPRDRSYRKYWTPDITALKALLEANDQVRLQECLPFCLNVVGHLIELAGCYHRPAIVTMVVDKYHYIYAGVRREESPLWETVLASAIRANNVEMARWILTQSYPQYRRMDERHFWNPREKFGEEILAFLNREVAYFDDGTMVLIPPE